MEDEETIPAETTAPAPEPAAAAPAAPEETSKRLSKEQWAEIARKYERGEKRAKDLAAEYGVSGSAISQHFKRNGVGQFGSKKGMATTPTPVNEADALAAAFAEKRKLRIAQTKEHAYIQAQVNQILANKIQKELKDGTRTPAAAASDIKSLRHLQKLLEDNYKLRSQILRIDAETEEEELPELQFHELTPEQIEEIAKADEDEEADIDLDEEAEAGDDEDEDEVVVEEGDA